MLNKVMLSAVVILISNTFAQESAPTIAERKRMLDEQSSGYVPAPRTHEGIGASEFAARRSVFGEPRRQRQQHASSPSSSSSSYASSSSGPVSPRSALKGGNPKGGRNIQFQDGAHPSKSESYNPAYKLSPAADRANALWEEGMNTPERTERQGKRHTQRRQIEEAAAHEKALKDQQTQAAQQSMDFEQEWSDED